VLAVGEVVLAGEWPAKDPEDKLDYYVNFEDECARFWERNTTYALGDRVRPQKATGFEYEASAGTSGDRPPVFPTTVGRTVADGSITWTCRALSTSSLRRTITGTPSWTVDTGLTVESVAIAGMISMAYLSGGIHGQTYSVRINAAFSDGSDITATCVLPVERPRRAA
jgi:hypothetical protein